MKTNIPHHMKEKFFGSAPTIDDIKDKTDEK